MSSDKSGGARECRLPLVTRVHSLPYLSLPIFWDGESPARGSSRWPGTRCCCGGTWAWPASRASWRPDEALGPGKRRPFGLPKFSGQEGHGFFLEEMRLGNQRTPVRRVRALGVIKCCSVESILESSFCRNRVNPKENRSSFSLLLQMAQNVWSLLSIPIPLNPGFARARGRRPRVQVLIVCLPFNAQLQRNLSRLNKKCLQALWEY